MNNKLKCEVCGNDDTVGVYASNFGPVSYAYCSNCVSLGLEPYTGMVAYISAVGSFPEDVNITYQEEVRRILKAINKTEEQFIIDVDKSIKDMEDYFKKMESENQ